MGAQKNRLSETVLLSTHYICFCWEIRKLTFDYALLSGRLSQVKRKKTIHNLSLS